MLKGQMYAIITGLVGSLAGVCNKIAMASSEATDICEEVLSSYAVLHNKTICSQWSLTMRVMAFVVMLALNSSLLIFFTKALRYSNTSIEATITSTAASFLFTAVVGKTIFDEEVTSLWWTGMVLILSGLVLLHLTNAQAEKTRKPGTLPRKKDKLF